MKIDLEKLTLGEVAKVEELSGISITEITEAGSPKGLALAALVFVAKRREDMSFSWNEAKGLTIDEANEILGLADDEDDDTAAELEQDPTEGEGTSKRPSPRPQAKKSAKRD